MNENKFNITILIMGIVAMIAIFFITSLAFAGARGTGYNRTKTVNGRECIYFYDHNNNLLSVSCSC